MRILLLLAALVLFSIPVICQGEEETPTKVPLELVIAWEARPGGEDVHVPQISGVANKPDIVLPPSASSCCIKLYADQARNILYGSWVLERLHEPFPYFEYWISDISVPVGQVYLEVHPSPLHRNRAESLHGVVFQSIPVIPGGGSDAVIRFQLACDPKVLPGQSIVIGQKKPLACAGLNRSQQRYEYISQKATYWQVVKGKQHLRIDRGIAQGLSPGTAMVTVTVDGITSEPVNVAVVRAIPPAPRGKILFTMGYTVAIPYAVSPDGLSAPAMIPSMTVAPHAAFFSQDGRKISLSDTNDAGLPIATSIANIDGSGARLMYRHFYAGGAVLSPRGDAIVYSMTGDDGCSRLWLQKTTSKSAYPLLDRSNMMECYSPRFSYDGKQVIFSSYSGAGGIVMVNIDGTGFRTLTTPNALTEHAMPALSPDGRRAVFCLGEETKYYLAMLDIVAGETGKITRLTDGKPDISCPMFSPDGKEIVYLVREKNISNIHILNLQSGIERSVTHNTDECMFFSPPVWTH